MLPTEHHTYKGQALCFDHCFYISSQSVVTLPINSSLYTAGSKYLYFKLLASNQKPNFLLVNKPGP